MLEAVVRKCLRTCLWNIGCLLYPGLLAAILPIFSPTLRYDQIESALMVMTMF